MKLKTATPIPVESAIKFLKFSQLLPISVTRDGKWLAYTTKDDLRAQSSELRQEQHSDAGRQWSGTDIWIENTRTGESNDLTKGDGDSRMPTWSPDGRYLAYLSTRGDAGNTHLWVWDALKNETKKVSNADLRTIQIEWLPDSSRVVVAEIPEPGTKNGPTLPTDQRSSRAVQPARPIVSVYQWPGGSGQGAKSDSDPWSLEKQLRDLITLDVSTGKKAPLVRGERISWFQVSPNGLSIAFTNPQRFETAGSQQILFDVSVVRVEDRHQTLVATGVRFGDGRAFSWSPDSRHLSFQTGGPQETNFDCYVIDVTDGSSRNLTGFPPSTSPQSSATPPLWDTTGDIYILRDSDMWQISPQRGATVRHIANRRIAELIALGKNLLWTVDDGKSTIVLTQDDSKKQDGFYKINLETGSTTPVLENGECYTCTNTIEHLKVTGNGRHVVYWVENAQHAPDLWISDAGFSKPVRLTRLNEEFDRYEMGKASLVHWRSGDGELLSGALLLPSSYQEGSRYPLIVFVYAGSRLSNLLNNFGFLPWVPFNMQLLATRGYAVLLPDTPVHQGTLMQDLAKSALPAVDKLVEDGIADPERVAVMGHSFGGYSALSLIVQTNRFKAAVDMSGPGNLIEEYGVMDHDGKAYGTALLEQGARSVGGTIWESRDRYIENSPFFYLDRVNTPLLIIQGTDDEVVPAFLADETFVGLRRLGKKVEYAKYETEGHSPQYWDFVDQVDVCERILRWFDDHLTGSDNAAGSQFDLPSSTGADRPAHSASPTPMGSRSAHAVTSPK